MMLPELPPDLSFPALTATPADRDFAYDVKKAALGPYVAARWGWDGALQRDLHACRFREKPFSAIQRGPERLGVLSLDRRPDHVRFGEFYLLPVHQRQGIGSRILRHVLTLADAQSLPVHLEHLLWNPVGTLYRRHGFTQTHRTNTHIHLERPFTSQPPQV